MAINFSEAVSAYQKIAGRDRIPGFGDIAGKNPLALAQPISSSHYDPGR